MPDSPYDLEARSVWAGYPAAEGPALRGVDLSLPPGRRVLIAGPSGAGKSTLASVLLGFLPCQAGSVSLNGTPVDRLSGDDLRTAVGLVGQDAFLFDSTIAENLRIGRRDATDDELRQVLERVGLADWFCDLPRGLRTMVGRHGARLSGGQRQRIAVARALLADFPLIVFDEPAEHLDPGAARSLIADLLRVTDDRSLVLISHQLVGLESVDEILLLDAGRVVERGTHEQLLGQCGRYARLWWDETNVAQYPESREARTHRQPREPVVAAPSGPPSDWSPVR